MADSFCPGRHLAQKGMPDSPSAASESGQKIHAALAAGSQLQGGRPTLDALNVEEREVYDACETIRCKVVEQYFGNFAGKPYREFREQRLWAKFKFNGVEYEHSGQYDFAARCETKALILDYKTLAGEVAESSHNLQLRDLACLLAGNMVPTEEVAVAIVQPFVTHKPELCVYNRADLTRATKAMFDRVVTSNDPKSRRIAGEVQCKFCKARSKCVEYQKWAGQITPPAMLGILSVPMQSWTPEQCATAANALGPCQKFLDELKDLLKSRLEADPLSVPGWTLKPGFVRESITNPAEVFKRFVGLGGNVEQFMPVITVTKAKLKEAAHELTGARGKQLDAAMETLTNGCVQGTQTAPSLKRVDKGEVQT